MEWVIAGFVLAFVVLTFFSIKKILKEQKDKKAKAEKEAKEKEKAKEAQKKTEQKKEDFLGEVLKKIKQKNEQKVEQEVIAEIKEKELFSEEKKTSLDELELKDLKFEKLNTKEEQEFMQKYRADKYREKPDMSDVFEGFDAVDVDDYNYKMSEIFEQKQEEAKTGSEPVKPKGFLNINNDESFNPYAAKTKKKKESLKTQMKNLSNEMQAVIFLDLLKERE